MHWKSWPASGNQEESECLKVVGAHGDRLGGSERRRSARDGSDENKANPFSNCMPIKGEAAGKAKEVQLTSPTW